MTIIYGVYYLFVVMLQTMAAFLPETDSEDELPGEWEERVTVDGSVRFFCLYFYVNIMLAPQVCVLRPSRHRLHPVDSPQDWEEEVCQCVPALRLGEDYREGEQGGLRGQHKQENHLHRPQARLR